VRYVFLTPSVAAPTSGGGGSLQAGGAAHFVAVDAGITFGASMAVAAALTVFAAWGVASWRARQQRLVAAAHGLTAVRGRRRRTAAQAALPHREPLSTTESGAAPSARYAEGVREFTENPLRAGRLR
jgi:hypothetical protein